MPRLISVIAQEIVQDWKPVHPWAAPYVEAMKEINSVESPYGAEIGRDVVIYFLSNASSWKGDVARRVKAELREMIK